MKTIYVDCELAGSIGKRHLVTKTTDGLYDLRQACRDALNATPKEDWCEGKTAEEIITDLVSHCLNLKTPGCLSGTTEVHEIWMGRRTVRVILRLPRATAMNIRISELDVMTAYGNAA